MTARSFIIILQKLHKLLGIQENNCTFVVVIVNSNQQLTRKKKKLPEKSGMAFLNGWNQELSSASLLRATYIASLLPFHREITGVECHITIPPCWRISLYRQRCYPLTFNWNISKVKFQLNIGIAFNGGSDIFHITKLIFAAFVSISFYSVNCPWEICFFLLSTVLTTQLKGDYFGIDLSCILNKSKFFYFLL